MKIKVSTLEENGACRYACDKIRKAFGPSFAPTYETFFLAYHKGITSCSCSAEQAKFLGIKKFDAREIYDLEACLDASIGEEARDRDLYPYMDWFMWLAAIKPLLEIMAIEEKEKK